MDDWVEPVGVPHVGLVVVRRKGSKGIAVEIGVGKWVDQKVLVGVGVVEVLAGPGAEIGRRFVAVVAETGRRFAAVEVGVLEVGVVQTRELEVEEEHWQVLGVVGVSLVAVVVEREARQCKVADCQKLLLGMCLAESMAGYPVPLDKYCRLQ